MTCKINGCCKPIAYVEQGVCQMHYFRFWRNGTFETIRKRGRQYRIEMPGRGYQRLYEPNHPLSDTQGYVAEHRMVVYERYGYTLPDCEICGKPTNWTTCHIDHKDDDVRNNDRDNLRPLCPGCNTWRSMPPAHTFSRCSSITFNGETKTALEWSRDPRVAVSNAAIMHRKRLGASDYDALFAPKKTHNGKVPVRPPRPPAHTRKNSISATINGVTKTSMEWARTAGCTVSDGTVRARIKAGWPHDLAVFAAPKASIQPTYKGKLKALQGANQ